MVWFYHENFNTLTYPSNLTFNPTMVWFYLEPHFQFEPAPERRLSIPLWSDFIEWWQRFTARLNRGGTAFNPTMVWFYRSDSRKHTVPQSAFNPTMVWFYRRVNGMHSITEDSLSIPLWSDFIKVQKKLWRMTTYSFQSHYGLILSLVAWYCLLNFNNLSIPLWSDFILLVLQKFFPEIPVFQSHYGLILSKRYNYTCSR